MADTGKKSVFLFYGEDNYQSTQKLNFWKEEFIKKYGDINIETIEAKDLNYHEFLTNIGTLPFLAEKRLMIIKDFLDKGRSEDQKMIAEGLEKISDSCIVVFQETEIPDKRTALFQKIKKIGVIEEFEMLSPPEIAQWITEYSKKNQIKISPQVVNYLATYTSLDLFTVKNELDKLSFFANGREITIDMIDNLVTPSLSSSIFKLTDAIAAKNIQQSIKILRILIESGEDLGKIFFMIVRHFRILIQIHDLLSKGEKQFTITQKLKLHPFVVQTISSQAKNFTLSKLKQIYQNLLQIDIGIKTGKIRVFSGDNKEFALAIEKLILNCCK